MEVEEPVCSFVVHLAFCHHGDTHRRGTHTCHMKCGCDIYAFRGMIAPPSYLHTLVHTLVPESERNSLFFHFIYSRIFASRLDKLKLHLSTPSSFSSSQLHIHSFLTSLLFYIALCLQCNNPVKQKHTTPHSSLTFFLLFSLTLHPPPPKLHLNNTPCEHTFNQRRETSADGCPSKAGRSPAPRPVQLAICL